MVLDAFARIVGEIPGAELILMGDLGPPDQPNVRAILEQVARHPARAQIRLTGRLSLAEIASEMAALDLYLFAMETGANTRSSTLPSALGAGIPTVAVRGAETDLSLFHDGDNLVFADDMTGAAFAEAALRLLKDPAALARVGEGGRRLYDEHLSWERIGDRLLADTIRRDRRPRQPSARRGRRRRAGRGLGRRRQAGGLRHRRRLSRASSLAGTGARRCLPSVPILRNRILAASVADRLAQPVAAELGARLAARASRGLGPRFSLYNALFTAHDLAVSLGSLAARDDRGLRLRGRRPLDLPSARRGRGLERIWDLPLPHYLTIEETLTAEFHRWPGAALGPPHREPDWKQRRKDAELALATKVSVASAFTRKSLERFDLRVADRGHAVRISRRRLSRRGRSPLPADSPCCRSARTICARGRPTCSRPGSAPPSPTPSCTWWGRCGWPSRSSTATPGTFRHWPHVPKSELGARYAAADLLVFPTLGDGFGLVIQEAMCSGTPVVTTPCGGGPECITDGVDGWIVPPRDIDALVERLRSLRRQSRTDSHEVGRAARARAERWTWRDAGRALVGRAAS